MTKHYPDGAVIKDAQVIASLSPTMVKFIASYDARQKLLLDEWIRELTRRRAKDDAESAVDAFIAICVLVAVAVSLVLVL